LLPKENPKIQSQLNYANTENIPFAVIIGEDEVQKGIVQLKNLTNSEQELVARAEMIPRLKEKLAAFNQKKN
jgi:histidyl-tRNA synthetase